MKTVSKKPSKQRKNIYDSKINEKRKYLVAPVDKAISSKIGKKKIAIKKGDTVKIVVGDNKGKSGKVEKVDYNKLKIYIKDIKVKTTRGQEKLLPFVASNLVITELNLEDNKRIKNKINKDKVK